MNALKWILVKWAWVKTHWKWVLFPIGLISSFLGWYFWWVKKDDETSATSDEAANRTVGDIIRAHEEHDKALADLEVQQSLKLRYMTSAQQQEYNEVRKRPIEEVAEWIDRL